MKYQVIRFKSLTVALKELEPFIRIGEHIQTGKPFDRFRGLRSRELLGNWLLCVVANSVTQPDRLSFSSDPLGGDGIIYDSVTEATWPTEHVLVPKARDGELQDVEPLILKAIARKQSKGGAAYASGKTLVVFLNARGREWLPNRVAGQLPTPLLFEAVWVVGLQSVEAGEYVYGVTRLDLSRGNAPAWRVRIGKDFDAWKVEAIQ
ncbi:MAG: hypothetical protein ABI612_26595 [Betaproteobacteria bacterium]